MLSKLFWSKNVLVEEFFCCLIIFMESLVDKNFFGRFFFVSKEFLAKVQKKNFYKHFFGNFFYYYCNSIYSETVWMKIIFWENFLLEKLFGPIFLVPKQFVNNWDERNIFEIIYLIESFLSKYFYGCKIISSKIGCYQKFSSNFFVIKFMVAKSYPQK